MAFTEHACKHLAKANAKIYFTFYTQQKNHTITWPQAHNNLNSQVFDEHVLSIFS
jgi:hypothetical protein